MIYLKDGDDIYKLFMYNKKFEVQVNIIIIILKWFDGKDVCLIFGSEIISIEVEENI